MRTPVVQRALRCPTPSLVHLAAAHFLSAGACLASLLCGALLLLQIAQTQAMLANEYGTASNIKSRVNRQSVLAAITSAQQRLKLYTKAGPHCPRLPCL